MSISCCLRRRGWRHGSRLAVHECLVLTVISDQQAERVDGNQFVRNGFRNDEVECPDLALSPDLILSGLPDVQETSPNQTALSGSFREAGGTTGFFETPRGCA
jgi:hypothetical protein